MRIKAPTMKDILDLDQDNVSGSEPLRITAPPPPTPSRLVYLKASSFRNFLLCMKVTKEQVVKDQFLSTSIPTYSARQFILKRENFALAAT